MRLPLSDITWQAVAEGPIVQEPMSELLELDLQSCARTYYLGRSIAVVREGLMQDDLARLAMKYASRFQPVIQEGPNMYRCLLHRDKRITALGSFPPRRDDPLKIRVWTLDSTHNVLTVFMYRHEDAWK